jgi:FKBP-type peptidyl-prolyl cis-trans isomerase 2
MPPGSVVVDCARHAASIAAPDARPARGTMAHLPRVPPCAGPAPPSPAARSVHERFRELRRHDHLQALRYEQPAARGSRGAAPYLHGGHSGIFPKIEQALNFKKVGESVSVTLEPTDAFGDYDPQLMRVEAVDQLPPDVTVGGYLVAEQDGNEVVWRVTGIADGKAVLDGNHELAGSGCASTARCSTCARPRRRSSRTVTCTARRPTTITDRRARFSAYSAACASRGLSASGSSDASSSSTAWPAAGGQGPRRARGCEQVGLRAVAHREPVDPCR